MIVTPPSSVTDHDDHFVIDPITRNISPRKVQKSALVQFDHNSERYTFEVPRYIEGHDMSTCSSVRIHYNNVSSDKKSASSDIYMVNDLTVADDGETLTFTWLVGKNATKFPGRLNFSVQFIVVTNDPLVDLHGLRPTPISGSITYSWSTKTYNGLSIAAGTNNAPAIREAYSDVLAKLELNAKGYVEDLVPSAVDEECAGITETLRQELLAHADATIPGLVEEKCAGVQDRIKAGLEGYVDEVVAAKLKDGDEVGY